MRKILDKNLFYILFGYAFAYLIYNSLKGAILKLIGSAAFIEISWRAVLFDHVLANIFIMPPTIIIIILITRFLFNRHYNWKGVVVIHFIFSIIYILFIYLLSYAYQVLTDQRSLESINARDFFVDVVSNSNLHFLGYVGFVCIIYCYYYINENVKIKLQKTQLSQQLTSVKLEMLKAQLNPHFLFNTLHSISSLVKQDPDKAQNMLVSLGDLLREIIFINHEDKITLNKEIDILKKYIDIMLIRFSDHLSIDINIEDEAKMALVPSLLTQPIIENSLKYGYSSNHTNLHINISVIRTNKKLIIRIDNNGKALEKNQKIAFGTGIRNIKERLETLYGTDFSFNFSSLDNNKGVVTIIKIPFQV